MSVGDALSKASIRLIGEQKTNFFGASGTFELEVTDLVNEVADDLRKAHDWQVLTKLATLTGDGNTEDLTLPSDFGRLLLDPKIWDASWDTLYFRKAESPDAYYVQKTFTSSGAPGWWIILGGKLNIWPILGDTRQAKFYYIKNQVGTDNDDAAITQFSADDDTSLLPERLLTLGVIWKHKAQKGLEYAEDLANYEKALGDFIRDDKGASVIRMGGSSFRGAYGTPWPGEIIV